MERGYVWVSSCEDSELGIEVLEDSPIADISRSEDDWHYIISVCLCNKTDACGGLTVPGVPIDRYMGSKHLRD